MGIFSICQIGKVNGSTHPIDFSYSASALLEEVKKGLGDRRERAMPVKDLVEVALQAEAADGNFPEQAVADLAPDGGSRQDGNPKAGDERLLDRFRAAELHDDVEQLLGPALLFGEKLAKGAQRPGASLA